MPLHTLPPPHAPPRHLEMEASPVADRDRIRRLPALIRAAAQECCEHRMLQTERFAPNWIPREERAALYAFVDELTGGRFATRGAAADAAAEEMS